MSEEEDDTNTCASCGKAGGDDIKLMKCIDCHYVRYCSDKCQRDHRPQHKNQCKKRVAELHDEILFNQPESSHFGDCPICCLPQPTDPKKSTVNTCCSKRICKGCYYANQIREIQGRLQQKCPFCRKALPKTKEERKERLVKRAEANDPVAISYMGMIRKQEGDYEAAFDYWSQAAALGDVEAHYHLSCLYFESLYPNGVAVDEELIDEGYEKDEKKFLHHLTEAAIGGHFVARHDLGVREEINGRFDRAVKHFIIAAKLGYDPSLKSAKSLYRSELMSKDDFTTALRGYQAAIEAAKSPQRERV